MSVGRYYHHLLPLPYNKPPPLSAEHVALRDQLAEHNAAALELSSRLNAFSLPCKLPPEILSKIFVMSAAAIHEEDIRWNAAYGPMGGFHGYYRWISVALVCRYWRSVALGCAPFWAFIAFEKYHMPCDMYPTLLRRSKGCPLTIVYHSREDCICQPCSSMWYVDSIGQEIISEELPRIRHLIIIISSNDFSTYKLWEELVASAPSLETLEVGHTRLPDDYALELPNSLFQSDLPRLRSLALRSFKYEWTNSLLRSSLRTLEIIDRSAPSPTHVDMHGFISMLSTMSQLEHLVVEGFSPAHPVNAVASLPQLRYIKLTGDVEGLAFVLSGLRFPSNTAIHLIISYAPNLPVAGFVKALSRTLSASHLHTASYTVPDDFYIGISPYFRAWSGTLTGADRTVNRLWSPQSDIPPRILLAARKKDFISSIVARLHLPHLIALFVSIGCAMAPDCTWNKWFVGAPNVSFLRLSERAGYRVGELLSMRVRMQDDEASSSSDTDASDDEPPAETESDYEPDEGADTELGSEADEESSSEIEDVDSDEDTQAGGGADDDHGSVSQTSDGEEFHVEEGASGDPMSCPPTDSDDESWVITAVMPSLRTIQFVDVVFPYAPSLSYRSDSDRDPVERTREFDADGMVKGLEVRKNLGAQEVERIEFVRCRGLQVSRLQTLVDIVEDVVVDGNGLTKLD